MIIEALTAFAAVKIGWEILEILHLIHVCHITGKASYKGGGFIKRTVQQQYQKWQDQNNPVQQLEREAEICYDLQATGDVTQAIQDINNQAKAYLTTLKDSVGSLKNAKDYFLAIHTSLTGLVHALTTEDGRQFSSQLLRFKSNFGSFKDELNQFSLSIEPPPRQPLYIADLSGTKVIKRYNDSLKTIKTYIELLQQIEQDISDQFKQGFNVIPILLTATNSSFSHSFEQLQQDIKQCMHSPKQLSETMHAILPNNTKLAVICTDIIQIFAVFQQTHQTEQTNPLEGNPDWMPLLTEVKQIETGQRIFLHAMNETDHSEEEKLLFAHIFLRQSVPKPVVNQIEVDLLAHEMACALRCWQIKKCAQLIRFLSTLTQGSTLPKQDPDGLLAWLKTGRRTQSQIALFKEILVSPCCFSQCSIESALANLKPLVSDKNADTLIQQHRDSHWDAIWEKNDTLIQLPKSFYSNIFPRQCREPDDPSKNADVVSSVMQKLATALVAGLQRLKTKWESNKFHYLDVKLNSFYKKQNKVTEAQKNQEHEKGVARIRKAHRYIDAITSFTNNLSPYLHQDKTINKADQKPQVPTVEDLLHVIYRGVDPNGVCSWKDISSTAPQSNQLVNFVYPDQQNDSRMKAWLYAYADCQVDMVPLFSYLFSATDHPLAFENRFSIQAIFKDSKKISFMTTHSKTLNNVTPETVKATETIFKQLQDYYVLALVRMKPEYLKQLPLMKQLECLFKNLFKFGQKIGAERLESV